MNERYELVGLIPGGDFQDISEHAEMPSLAEAVEKYGHQYAGIEVQYVTDDPPSRVVVKAWCRQTAQELARCRSAPPPRMEKP